MANSQRAFSALLIVSPQPQVVKIGRAMNSWKVRIVVWSHYRLRCEDILVAASGMGDWGWLLNAIPTQRSSESSHAIYEYSFPSQDTHSPNVGTHNLFKKVIASEVDLLQLRKALDILHYRTSTQDLAKWISSWYTWV